MVTTWPGIAQLVAGDLAVAARVHAPARQPLRGRQIHVHRALAALDPPADTLAEAPEPGCGHEDVDAAHRPARIVASAEAAGRQRQSRQGEVTEVTGVER
jgi:hypothetical protein